MGRWYIEVNNREVGNYLSLEQATIAFEEIKAQPGVMIVRLFENDSVVRMFERTED